MKNKSKRKKVVIVVLLLLFICGITTSIFLSSKSPQDPHPQGAKRVGGG